jgi:RNA polymerase-binding transcription factor DksA
MLPVVGQDAARARTALRALQPSIFDEGTTDSGTACEVCGEPISMERVLNAAMRGHRAAYDTDRCRETARKRRYRAP